MLHHDIFTLGKEDKRRKMEKEKSGQMLQKHLDSIKGRVHKLINRLEDKQYENKAENIFEEIESQSMTLRYAIEHAVSDSDIHQTIKRLNFLKEHLQMFMQELLNNNQEMYEIPEELKEKLVDLEEYLESEVEKHMEELKHRLENIHTSLMFLHSKVNVFCADQTNMDTNKIEDGLEVFLVTGALLNSQFVQIEKICRYNIVPLIRGLGIIVLLSTVLTCASN